MPSHRAPESRAPRPAPGPVDLVDTTPTTTIDLSSPPAEDAKRPEPVMKAATIAGAVSGVILTVGGLLKLLTPWVPDAYDLQTLATQAGDAITAIGVASAVVTPWITARIKARDKVTPLEDPRDLTGRPLVPRVQARR